eukprot:7603730-Pyramimonas_sp.AAC.1
MPKRLFLYQRNYPKKAVAPPAKLCRERVFLPAKLSRTNVVDPPVDLCRKRCSSTSYTQKG